MASHFVRKERATFQLSKRGMAVIRAAKDFEQDAPATVRLAAMGQSWKCERGLIP
jgi:hypothetical protein